jgi:hypothetical protein
MIGWLIAGAIGVMGYRSYCMEQFEKNSFHNKSTKHYSKYGSMWLNRSEEGMLVVFVDELAFCRIKKGSPKEMFKIGNFPVGGKLNIILDRFDGNKVMVADEIITENKLCETYSHKVQNNFDHGLYL